MVEEQQSTNAAGTEMAAARRRIEAAYSPDLLRQAGNVWLQRICQHLESVNSSEGNVLNWNPPTENIALATAALQQASEASSSPPTLQRFADRLEEMFTRCQNLHDPRYIGHQVPASVPLAGLFDAVGSVTNQVMAIYEMGPWATAVERAILTELGQRIGWSPDEFAGLITHGGSLANMTALLTARNVVLEDSWSAGMAGHRDVVLLVHQDAHYSIARAAGVLGMGSQQVEKVGLDDKRRICPDALRSRIAECRAQGKRILAVVACACATPIGAFDRLDRIGPICQQEGLWLHVDAAHGASALFSDRHAELLNGLHHADSVVWDAHKMLFVPALCAMVFYKKKEHGFATFQQNAPYLFDPSAPGMAEYDSGLLTIECTKRAAAYGLWGVWSLFGTQLFADLIDVTFASAFRLYEMLCAADDFQVIHEPQCNIVAFRFAPDSLREREQAERTQCQHEIRRRLIESGEFYITQATIEDEAALRVTVCNPLTDERHFSELLTAIRRIGTEVCRAG